MSLNPQTVQPNIKMRSIRIILFAEGKISQENWVRS
jgi:hypothetical protein